MKPLSAVIVAVSLIVFSQATQTSAASFEKLYIFTPWENSSHTNVDGAGINPVIVSGAVLYGSAAKGGAFGDGTIFEINTDGSGFTNLYNFTAMSSLSHTNMDGADPAGELLLSGNRLYGVAFDGGTGGNGTIFSINTDGTGFTNLHSFSAETSNTNSDGAKPRDALVEGDGVLYGVTEGGGDAGDGTIFKINTDGSGFAVIYSFTSDPGAGNADGIAPLAGLVLSGTTLFGTTFSGGTNDFGVVFSVNTDGNGFTTLHNFSSLDASATNVDGAHPWSRLRLSGNMLYGTTTYGGAGGRGTVFSVNTNGTNFNTLYNFTAVSSTGTNNDGARPRTGLVKSGNLLFGTAEYAGPGNSGTVFQMCQDGSGFTNLYSFAPGTPPDGFHASTNSDGVNPSSRLTLSGNTLFGTTYTGGPGAAGVIFALQGVPSGAIPLQITAQGNSAVLTWSDPTFSLQAASSLGGSFTNVPDALSPYTNVMTGIQQVFRLNWSP
jgi:uncharacterized repeat protein (TIGR03803 family)